MLHGKNLMVFHGIPKYELKIYIFFLFFKEIFSKMKNNGYYVTVIEDINSEKVVGSATLFIEYKFIHGGCLVLSILNI